MDRKERAVLDDLYNRLVGTADDIGFIPEMRQFKEETTKDLKRLSARIGDTENNVGPIIRAVNNWKFTAGFVVGLVSFVVGIIIIISYVRS